MKNFIYKFNWGLGSVISLLLEETIEGQQLNISFENWEQTNLPWIVLWVKELVAWGTLEPVAAYLLSIGIVVTRPDAEELAQEYYQTQTLGKTPNEQLNATAIRKWTKTRLKQKQTINASGPDSVIEVQLLRDFSKASSKKWRVLPVLKDSMLHWLDPAGFPLATCAKPVNWQEDYLEKYDFWLHPLTLQVLSTPYL